MNLRRLMAAVAAALLGVLVLSGNAGTWARWVATDSVDGGTISAGGVDLTRSGAAEVQLLSRQPANWRTWAPGSSTTCPVPSGYTECRVITNTLAEEKLISGDRIVVRDAVTLTASGTNLRGTMRLDATALRAATAFGQSATVEVQSARTGGTPGDGGASFTYPVDVSTGTGLGQYSVTATITTPPAPAGGGSWGTQHVGQALLSDNAITYTFVQANPAP